MPVFPRLDDDQLAAALRPLPVGRKMVPDRDVRRSGERLLSPREERAQAWILRALEIGPRVMDLGEAQLHVAAGQQPQAELAVHQGQAGKRGLVSLPADAKRAAQPGAEVSECGRLPSSRWGSRLERPHRGGPRVWGGV